MGYYLQEGERVAKLLGVDTQDLYKNLLKPRIKVGNEFVTQGRNKDQVIIPKISLINAQALNDTKLLPLIFSRYHTPSVPCQRLCLTDCSNGSSRNVTKHWTPNKRDSTSLVYWILPVSKFST